MLRKLESILVYMTRLTKGAIVYLCCCCSCFIYVMLGPGPGELFYIEVDFMLCFLHIKTLSKLQHGTRSGVQKVYSVESVKQ